MEKRKQKRGSRKKIKSQTNAKSEVYKGINFKSGLEVYMFKLLEHSDIPFSYEQRKFVIIEGFTSPNVSYEKFLNGKGDYKDRGSGKKYSDIVYTPDFTPPPNEPLNWVIEVKGRNMPDFSRTWKLFKKLLVKKKLNTILFMPRTQTECKKTIELLKPLYENSL